jgi:prepilin-type processing-associated H-X9-DG protein
MSDRQVDAQSKTVGQPVFSATGKAPGNNHDKSGGNVLFCDGHVQQTPSNAIFSLVLTPGILLLNP